MRMYELLDKKRLARKLSADDIAYAVQAYTKDEIPDYQMSALLMSIAINGMDNEETAAMTKAMVESGEIADLSAIRGVKVDKHSSGGVGDKTSPVVGAIVAACGVPVAKMSGRSLGFSGGTVDKLESIPGYTIDLPKEKFFEIVNTVGVSIIGQTGNLAPADKKIYGLRDVTATVESTPLIASSIMSKKIAGGADAILLDVKVGSGAFMKDVEKAVQLAKVMVSIGGSFHKETIALITQMDSPLGKNIGTSLEVIEMIAVLQNEEQGELKELCLALAANMLYLAGKERDMETCAALCEQALSSGKAFEKFREMVGAQGGDISVIDDPSLFAQAKYIVPVAAKQSGYIQSFRTERCGMASMVLGAGRETKQSLIDYTAGITLIAKRGDTVQQGQPLAYLHTSDENKIKRAEELFLNAVTIGQEKPQPQPLIYQRITSADL
ncbi:thymidine phosphorylase [Christensenellaceae bacterium OttesenSCG-928-K19]|nr:thymidine phosphorylase [Christensenellaceae bacterium OttesenSCG-928-K19]